MRRRDLAAGATIFLVLVQLLFAQLTIAITGCLLVVGKVSRWRLAWLAWPAVAGVAWVLADGLRPSLAGYLASGGHLVAHLARPQGRAIGLARLRDALAGWRRWLPAQLPLAVVVAAAEAALIGLAGRRDMPVRHRPGVLAVVRRAYLGWSTGRGELATADGGCLGIVVSTGRRAAVSWREAAGGVLCTGRDPASVAATGLALTLAAIAHRKAVLVIDLASGSCGVGGSGSADVIESACAYVGAPLRRFGGQRGASGDSRMSLRRALAGREVVLFSLDAARNGRPAAMSARLVLADVEAIFAEIAGLGASADCLIWVNGCELSTPAQLRALVAAGASAGVPVLLGTAADSAAAALASEVNVVAIRGHAPPSLRADRREQQEGPGSAYPPGSSQWAPLRMKEDLALPPWLTAGQHRDALSLLVRGPRRRALADCRAVR